MKIPLQPSTMTATLPEQDGKADQLIFHYTPLDPADQAEFSGRVLAQISGADLRSAPQNNDEEETQEQQAARLLAALAPSDFGLISRLYCEIFDRAVQKIVDVRGDNLQVGDADFDRNAEGHLRSVPARWKTSIGKTIFSQAKSELTEQEQGN